MNKKQKEVELAKLRDEKKVLAALKKQYEEAAKDVQSRIHIHTNKINIMLDEWDELDDEKRSILQSQIYQKQFQQQLKAQIDEVVKKLNAGMYKTIEDFLNDSFTTAFLGTMYDLHGQGIPLIMPIDRRAMVTAVELDPKLSKKLYGSYMDDMKTNIRAEISRGIATADSYEHIARNISNRTNQSFNKTMRIVRTEGHRIQIEAAYEQQQKAKKAGADIVKQWDATLDGRTRKSHRKLDGQIRELDEPFEVNGHKAMHPAAFGRPEEDINCRCALLQRAKWALDDEELETLKKRAEYFELDAADDFKDFQKKYLKAAEKVKTMPANFIPAKTIEDANKTGSGILHKAYENNRIAENLTLTPMEEMLDVFEAKYFHIGIDEVFYIGMCDRCKASGKTNGELLAEWCNKLAKRIKEKKLNKENVKPFLEKLARLSALVEFLESSEQVINIKLIISSKLSILSSFINKFMQLEDIASLKKEGKKFAQNLIMRQFLTKWRIKTGGVIDKTKKL